MLMALDAGRFERIGLEIGSGENRFSMSHGSFVYRQKHSGYRSLLLEKKTETPDGCELIYRDPVSREEIRLAVKREDARLTVSWQGGVPAGVNRFRVHIPTNPNEHVYGCGETYSKLDLKGELVRIWVAEHQNTRRISGKLVREKLRGKQPEKTVSP